MQNSKLKYMKNPLKIEMTVERESSFIKSTEKCTCCVSFSHHETTCATFSGTDWSQINLRFKNGQN